MDPQLAVRLAVYRHFVDTAQRPSLRELSSHTGLGRAAARRALQELQDGRQLVLEEDGESIRMAPPFSGVPTEHGVEVDGREYHANCAWDALGIPAALHRPAMVRSRCAQSGETLLLEVGSGGPPPSPWLFHSMLPAERWWDDIIFT